MIKKFDKLVRDGIPALIESQGSTCRVRTLSDEEYIKRLDQKLQEELDEYLADGSLEELADLVEVIRAVAEARSGSWDDIEALRVAKREQRGGFESRILLMDVDEG